MREIVTLQLGSLSNYTAAHFWNAQESYFTYGDQQRSPVDHNVHWRAGIGRDGAETFLPRTVIYDLKAAFGSLGSVNPLYGPPAPEPPSTAAADSLWPGPSTVHAHEAVTPSAYQQSLDAGSSPPKLTTSAVRYWSDYLRVYFHPKSLVQLYDAELTSAAGTSPEPFARGADLFDSLGSGLDIVDGHWRPFVEECDLLQGVQAFTTLDDAWGGFASSYLEALRDEHPKSCIWAWGLQSPPALGHASSGERRRLRLVNTAQSLSQACSQASVVVPLAVPDGRPPARGLALDPGSPWHVSGLLSAAAETAALPSRLAADSGHRPMSLSDLAETLNARGNQTLASAQLDVGPRAADLDRETLDVDLFRPGPEGSAGARAPPGRLFGQLSVYRRSSVDDDGAKDASPERPVPRPVAGNAVIRRFAPRLAFPLLDSYPPIYTAAAANQAGIAVRAVLSTDSSMAVRIGHLRRLVSRSVAPQERETLTNGLMEIADAYRDDWSSGSDGDGDGDDL